MRQLHLDTGVVFVLANAMTFAMQASLYSLGLGVIYVFRTLRTRSGQMYRGGLLAVFVLALAAIAGLGAYRARFAPQRWSPHLIDRCDKKESRELAAVVVVGTPSSDFLVSKPVPMHADGPRPLGSWEIGGRRVFWLQRDSAYYEPPVTAGITAL